VVPAAQSTRATGTYFNQVEIALKQQPLENRFEFGMTASATAAEGCACSSGSPASSSANQGYVEGSRTRNKENCLASADRLAVTNQCCIKRWLIGANSGFRWARSLYLIRRWHHFLRPRRTGQQRNHGNAND
jgi:hypothetical protein